MTNLHGDVALVLPLDATAPTVLDTDEYGIPRPGSATARYGWLGAKQRSAETPTGMVMMGVRLYNPTTGRFLQTDPEPGGSANDYDYCNADPINCTDVDGRWPHWAKRAGNWAWHHKVDIGLTVLSFAPGIGSAVWAYRAYRVVRIARAAYKAGRVGQSIRATRATSWLAGRMWVGRGAYRTTARNGAQWLRSRHHKFSWRSAAKKGRHGYSSNLDYSVRGHHDYWSFHVNHRRFF